MNINKVKLYALSTCIYCQNTKAFLNDRNVPFDCVEVDLLDDRAKLQILREIRALTPQVAFPVVVIGETVITGYRPEEIKKALGI